MISTELTPQGFITQSLDGDYGSFSEDRLTQLAAASFNHSRVFRVCFLKFLRARDANKAINARAETQRPVWRNGERGRLDMVVKRGHRTVAIVENKVDAPLLSRQLKFYNEVPELKSAKKIALVRHYFETQGFDANWRVLHWRDFYLVLRARVDGPKSIPPTDKFVLRSFIEYLEAANMHTPTRIAKRDMKDLARMLRGLRYASETQFRWIAPKGAVVPNSLVVSRGCPHSCDFCYKDAFFAGGPSFYTQTVDAALAEIERLPGRHLYFLDDHFFGDRRFASALCDGMKGMGRLWQAAGTVQSVLAPGLIEKAAGVGLRSLFVGFETLSDANLRTQHKPQNRGRDYAAAVRRLHDLGVMVNASFVFGMDDDDGDVFDRTVEWAVTQGIETATFHILTPYPGTALHRWLVAERRILSRDWDRYDTRHAVFQPAQMSPAVLEAGYWRAYERFYAWSAIFRGAAMKSAMLPALRHVAYAAGWKKLEPLWDWIIRARQVACMLPVLEQVLAGFDRRLRPGGAIKPLNPVPQDPRPVVA
jgi:hypothetical protein